MLLHKTIISQKTSAVHILRIVIGILLLSVSISALSGCSKPSKEASSSNTEKTDADNDSSSDSANNNLPQDSNNQSATQNAPDNNSTHENSQPDIEQPTVDLTQTNKPNNTIIEDISSLSTRSEGWGPGPDVNEKNQPYSALSYQKKYEKYNAHFIVPDSNDIHLVFSEGYENGYTPSILDTLKEKNVKAVFLITSGYARKNPLLVQRMIDEGHIVGNHSYNHPSNGFPSISIEEQENQIRDLHTLVKETFDYEMYIFGFPSGVFSEQSMAIANNCNYKTVFWSFAYRDYDTANPPVPEEALTKLIKNLHPGAIYMLHAVTPANAEILGNFIDQTRSLGYDFALFQ